MRPRRTTPQQDQEVLSRAQFTEAIALQGWRCESFSEDLGEDQFVRIYAEGANTGLSFAVQLKSKTRLDALSSAHAKLTHQFAIKDLLHWEDCNPPVVLVLWDVAGRSGVWRPVSEAIAELDSSKSGWRNRKKQKTPPTVAVTFARDKRCDKPGLDLLRRTIAMAALPMVSEGKELHMDVRFRFPKTQAGTTVARALEGMLSGGGAVQVPSSYVESIDMSEWWTRMFGKIPAFSTALALESLPSSRLVPISLRAETSARKRAELPYIGLRAIRGGTKKVTLSNADSASPVVLELVRTVAETTARMFLRYEPPVEGAALDTVLAYAEFLECCAEGATLTLTPLEPEAGSSATGWLAPQPHLALSAAFVSLVRDLVLIRDRLKVAVKLTVVTKGEDALAAANIAQIIRTGQCKSPITVTIRMRRTKVKEILETASLPARMRLSASDTQSFVLFGREVSLGEANVYFEGSFTSDNLSKAVNAEPGDEFFPVTVHGAGTRTFSAYSGQSA